MVSSTTGSSFSLASESGFSSSSESLLYSYSALLSSKIGSSLDESFGDGGFTSAFCDYSDAIGISSLPELGCLLTGCYRRTDSLSSSLLLLPESEPDSSDDSSDSPMLVGGLPDCDSPLVT